jgi:hypothetical protein
MGFMSLYQVVIIFIVSSAIPIIYYIIKKKKEMIGPSLAIFGTVIAFLMVLLFGKNIIIFFR